MQLNTDFKDWYDHAFERTGPVFERHCSSGLTRPEMMKFLWNAGLRTPRSGMAHELVPQLLSDWDPKSKSWAAKSIIEVVVHTDITAHRGEGKLLKSAYDALTEHPEKFCVEHIPTTSNGVGVSYRWLQVGNYNWFIKYWSENDWRSNSGVGGEEIIRSQVGRPTSSLLNSVPMFAIDFVNSGGRLLAIDFNIAPGLKPIQGHITASQIVDELKLFYSKHEAAEANTPKENRHAAE